MSLVKPFLISKQHQELKTAWHTHDMTSVVQALNQLMGSFPAPLWEGIPDAAFRTFISWAFQASQVCDHVREFVGHQGTYKLEVNLGAQPCLIVLKCLHCNHSTTTTECAQSILQLAAEAQLKIKENTIWQPHLNLILVIDKASPQIAYWRLIKHGLKFQSGWVEPFHEPAATDISVTTQDTILQQATDHKAAAKADAAPVATVQPASYLKTTFQYVIELAADQPNSKNQITVSTDRLVARMIQLYQKLGQAGIKFTPSELTPMVNAAIRASITTDASNAIKVDRAGLTEQLISTLIDLQ